MKKQYLNPNAAVLKLVAVSNTMLLSSPTGPSPVPAKRLSDPAPEGE